MTISLDITAPAEPGSLAAKYAEQTRPVGDGHRVWAGGAHVRIMHNGRRYTPSQAAFVIATGREPDGKMHTTCETRGCVAHVDEGGPAVVVNVTPGWHQRAACRDLPVSLFYPEEHRGRTSEVMSKALAVCAVCPVRADCLDEALEAEAGTGRSGRHGIRGGRTPNGRHNEYRRRRDAARHTTA